MTKRQSGALLTRIRLDRGGIVPVSRQIEDQLRDAIRAGQLPGGTRLPSSRSLAAELDVSRPTVMVVLPIVRKLVALMVEVPGQR